MLFRSEKGSETKKIGDDDDGKADDNDEQDEDADDAETVMKKHGRKLKKTNSEVMKKPGMKTKPVMKKPGMNNIPKRA